MAGCGKCGACYWFHAQVSLVRGSSELSRRAEESSWKILAPRMIRVRPCMSLTYCCLSTTSNQGRARRQPITTCTQLLWNFIFCVIRGANQRQQWRCERVHHSGSLKRSLRQPTIRSDRRQHSTSVPTPTCRRNQHTTPAR